MFRSLFLGLMLLLISGCAAVERAVPDSGELLEGASPAPDGVEDALAASPTGSPSAAETSLPVTGTATTLALPSATPSPQYTVTAVPTSTATPSATAQLTADLAQAAALELANAVPPRRDDARLALAYSRLEAAALATSVPAVTEPLSLGTRQTFSVLDVVNNVYNEIEAELFAVGEHAYFWFETGSNGVTPDENMLATAAAAFDEIYSAVTAVFGQENSPGIDGDARLHVLHASPQTICGLEPGTESGCGTAGFVSSSDLQAASVNPGSNEREMFVMNDRQFGGDYYLGVLAHEFRHLIESNYDATGTDWEIEGSAVLATQLAGLPSSGVERANLFLGNPDQQLNSWPETGKGPYYGQGYLFNRYLYDRLGETLYREFATSPLPGFVALDAVARENMLNVTGEALWVDWLAALVLHDHPQAPKKYAIKLDDLITAAVLPVIDLPLDMTTDVRQYAADYYQLPDKPVTVSFAGAERVPLLAGPGAADEVFWIAQRANYSNPRLTRTIDLRQAQAATLTYEVYADIEYGYDFAYASVSEDGGETWTPLAASNMQGSDPLDDPSGSALAPRFYTGRTQEWKHEIIDLSPFVGQEILLRFEMVTDPILTYSGLAVDNIAIPEIGYFDSGEADGWHAEGFTLTPALLPQSWYVQLIEYGDDGPIVTEIKVSDDGKAEFKVAGEDGRDQPLLIVAAAAPVTLETAHYQLGISEQ